MEIISSETQTLEPPQVPVGGAVASGLRDLVSHSLCYLVPCRTRDTLDPRSAVQEVIAPAYPCILPSTNDMCGLCPYGRAEGGDSLVLVTKRKEMLAVTLSQLLGSPVSQGHGLDKFAVVHSVNSL